VGRPGSHGIEFAPDGSHAFFLGSPPKPNAPTDLVVVDMITNNVKDITMGSGDVSSAQWSPAVPKK
jgi:hypothetical protein